jgi:hypothetical protein
MSCNISFYPDDLYVKLERNDLLLLLGPVLSVWSAQWLRNL